MKKLPKATRARYRREAEKILVTHRAFIDQYLTNESNQSRQSMDLLYASRSFALNKNTLEYMALLSAELNDVYRPRASETL